MSRPHAQAATVVEPNNVACVLAMPVAYCVHLYKNRFLFRINLKNSWHINRWSLLDLTLV